MWADVILRLEGYDEAATALLEPICEVPIFVCAATAYQWCAELGVWQAFDPASEIGMAMTDPLVRALASAAGRRDAWRVNLRTRWRRIISVLASG